MREETLYQNGRKVATIYHPAIPVIVCPKIVDSEERDGQLLYIDSVGGRHVAEIFDQKWGKRESGKILPKQKSQFQRIRKM